MPTRVLKLSETESSTGPRLMNLGPIVSWGTMGGGNKYYFLCLFVCLCFLTINNIFLYRYVLGSFAPGRCTLCGAGDSATEGYICGHNMLNSHAKVGLDLYFLMFKKI